jgi:hypothetical protein
MYAWERLGYLMVTLDAVSFFDGPNQAEEQISVLEVLQKLGYQSINMGGRTDVAD